MYESMSVSDGNYEQLTEETRVALQSATAHAFKRPFPFQESSCKLIIINC